MRGHVRKGVCGVILAFGFLVSTAFAQNYPKGPVKLVVPFPAGGGADTAGRLLAIQLGRNIGGSFVVKNRSGANGNIGTELVAKASPDSQTLLFTGAGLVTNPSLYPVSRIRTGNDRSIERRSTGDVLARDHCGTTRRD